MTDPKIHQHNSSRQMQHRPVPQPKGFMRPSHPHLSEADSCNAPSKHKFHAEGAPTTTTTTKTSTTKLNNNKWTVDMLQSSTTKASKHELILWDLMTKRYQEPTDAFELLQQMSQDIKL